jgi:cytoplasmic iron level regulating protein YaaA (DUF328/UPF0246 family)
MAASYSVSGTISSTKPKTTSPSSSYLNAIQSLLQQGQANSEKQLADTTKLQSQILDTQKQQVQKSQIREQEASMQAQTDVKDNYTSLLQQLMTLSQRNVAQNQRMFS